MGVEIERKFLVSGDFHPFVKMEKRIVQGYLCSLPERTVRIRICGEEAFITIKGPSNDSGLTRYEFEQTIPLKDGEELIKLCEKGVIEKVRHYIPDDTYTWEVDVFSGENEGLIIAEIELNDESDQPILPFWLGEEVTGDPRYYNSMLSQHPYETWHNSRT